MMKNKKGNPQYSRDRNAPFKPWKRLVPFMVPPEAAASGVVAAFQNHLVTVFIKETDSPQFANPDGTPMRIAHLMLQWNPNLKGTDGFWYNLKQKVKRELCGEQSEALELFPADWREENFNQTHIWASPHGATFPLGIIPRDIEKAMAEHMGGEQNVVQKEDMEVFVVRHEGMIEVFESEAEAKEMYGKTGADFPDSAGIEMIGNVPVESSEAAWTDRAKDKVANVLAKSKSAEEGLVIDDGHIDMESKMKEDMEKRRADERAAKVRAVTSEVTGKAQDNIDAAKSASERPKIIIP